MSNKRNQRRPGYNRLDELRPMPNGVIRTRRGCRHRRDVNSPMKSSRRRRPKWSKIRSSKNYLRSQLSRGSRQRTRLRTTTSRSRTSCRRRVRSSNLISARRPQIKHQHRHPYELQRRRRISSMLTNHGNDRRNRRRRSSSRRCM